MEGLHMKKGSALRILLLITLLVGMSVAVNGLELFNTEENSVLFNETKIILQEDAIDYGNVISEEVADSAYSQPYEYVVAVVKIVAVTTVITLTETDRGGFLQFAEFT